MRALVCVLVSSLAACSTDSSEIVGGAQGVWDGTNLTVHAAYQVHDGDVYRELLPASLEATIHGDTYPLSLMDNDATTLFPRHYYEAVIPLATPPDGETVLVDSDATPEASFTLPPGFEIIYVPPAPVQLPVTIAWTPVAPVRMEWWLTSPCLGDAESQQKHQVLRGDDVTLADEGKLTIDQLYFVDGPTTCELTLWIDRYAESDTSLVGFATQRRSVTFQASVE